MLSCCMNLSMMFGGAIMNINEWRDEVKKHNSLVDTILNDRKILKNHIADYIKLFFDYDDIDFSSALDRITLSFDYSKQFIIMDDVDGFCMDWSIDVDRGEIIIFPFGREGD